MSKLGNMHFIVPHEFQGELQRMSTYRVGDNYPYWLGGRFNWAAQTYLVLREHREGMSVGLAPVSGVLNFAHSMVWRALGPRQGEYRISVTADYPRVFDADWEIVQNPTLQTGSKKTYLPYWPVPGIIPRNPRRRGISTVAYGGRLGRKNLASPLMEGIDGMGAFGGLDFIIQNKEQWHDLSNVDLLVAIRSFDRRTYNNKPASKLFNSWLAGIPLIAGWDSAFSQVGRPNIDYIRVESEKELDRAVRELRENANLYASLVSAGIERRREVSHDAIVATWLQAIEGPIAEDFDRWKAAGREKRRLTAGRATDLARNIAGGLTKRLMRR